MDEQKTDARRLASLSDEELVSEVLSSWATVNSTVTKLSRRQLAVLIRAELLGKAREDIIKRIHQRFCQVRRKDELRALYLAGVRERYGAGGNMNDEDTAWLIGEVARPEPIKKRRTRLL